MVKKILALLVLCALSTAMLCGCWGKDDSSSSMPKPTSSPMTTPSGSTGTSSSSMPGSSALPGSSSMPGNSSMPGSGTNSASASVKPTLGDWNTALVNAETPLTGDFSVKTRSVEHYPDRQFDERAAAELEELLRAAAADGCPLYLVSAYRSKARQTVLYERKVNHYLALHYTPELARAQAAKWVAVPGTSEHNLGLAADIVSATWYNTHSDLVAEFDQTPEFRWLAVHCVDYGFVLRYPQGKTALTGVTYEPWHYRYVGKDAARYLTEQDLCLEELSA